jgi:hypothetical protein
MRYASGAVMSDDDDWDFAGADDAKATIRAAVRYCCEVLPTAPAVISCSAPDRERATTWPAGSLGRRSAWRIAPPRLQEARR